MTAALRYVSGRCAIGVKVESGNYAPCGLEPGHDGPHKPVLVPPAATLPDREAELERLLYEVMREVPTSGAGRYEHQDRQRLHRKVIAALGEEEPGEFVTSDYWIGRSRGYR